MDHNNAQSTPSNKMVAVNYFHQRIREYFSAFIFSLFWFFIFSIYIYYRRGFYDLYIINKIFAGVAAVQLGVVILLGALSRMFNIFDKYLHLRNEMGIMVFFLALTHSIVSLFFLPNHFPLVSYFQIINFPFIFGLTGIIIITGLFLISNQRSRDLFTVKKWWPIQYWGVRIAFVATALHVMVMKYQGWTDWYINGGAQTLKHPEWPGLGLLIGWYLLFVILIRICEAINVRAGRIFTIMSFVLLIWIYTFTFIWGTYQGFKFFLR